MTIRTHLIVLVCLTLSMSAVQAGDVEVPAVTVFKNVKVFNGTDSKLLDVDVLIEGNLIKQVGEGLSADGATVIDGDGRTLMPGLIDAHVHLIWNQSIPAWLNTRPSFVTVMMLKEAENTLMRGFTSVRDTAGDPFGVRSAIEAGLYPGPRIQGSGMAMGMTGGHVDFRPLTDKPRAFGGPELSSVAHQHAAYVVDGVPEVLAASRDIMRSGANFLKMTASGSVTGVYDPMDIAEFSYEEIKAAAGEAGRWNTYLAVHTYTDGSIETALKAGAKVIEHGNLITEKTMKLLAEKEAWLSTQTGVFMQPLPPGASEDQLNKQKLALNGLDSMFKLAKKYKVKIALGNDLVGPASIKETQNEELVSRSKWFSNAEILKQATHNNGKLFELAGPRNPYQKGPLGVVKVGAYADLLLVDGDPLRDIKIMADPHNKFKIIMKGGKIYKNTLN